MYPSRTAARLLFIPTPVKTFIGPLPGTPTDHLGLQSWPSLSPSLPLTTTICHPSSSHIYCSIASFDLFFIFYILSFFFFSLGRGGLFSLLIDVHVDEWRFILPNLGTAQYHANLKQEVSWSLRKTCRTKDRCSKQESSTQCALKQCTCESSVMENKLIFFFFLWLLTSALTWLSFSGIPQSTTVGPATIEPRFFDIFLTTHTRFHTQFSSLIVLR